jgi:hypothetical protein
MALWKPTHPHKTSSSKVMNLMKLAGIAAPLPVKIVQLVNEKAHEKKDGT